MASVTIRNLSDVTHRALKLRAAHNHRSLEAEIREILNDAVSPARRVKAPNPSRSEFKIGSEIARISHTRREPAPPVS
ncbi:MAG: plasmid stabilization protein [Terracidiphilus sp.]|jgi:plasmid stability protein